MLVRLSLGRKGVFFSESLIRFAQRFNYVGVEQLAREVAKRVVFKAPAKGRFENGIGEKCLACPRSALEQASQMFAQRITAKTQQAQRGTGCVSIELFG